MPAPQSKRGRIEVYEDRAGRFRYRVFAGNGQNVGTPHQSYSRRWSAKRAAQRTHPGWKIIDV